MGIQEELIKAMTKSIDYKSNLEINAEETAEKATTAAKQSQAVTDAYGNSLLAVGTDDKVGSFTNYGFSNDTLNWLLWLALYNDSWVFKRAIDKPAQDEIRCGITLQKVSADESEKIYKDLKQYRFDLIQLLQWGALYGGSVAIMMFDNLDDKDYSLPMIDKKIKQSKAMRLYVTDRWYGVQPSEETVTAMTNIDFGKPKYYNITFTDGRTLKVHHDYILRYEHRIAPKLVKQGMLQGWGYAEGSHILNELTRDDKLKASIQSLVDKSLIEVIKMSGMRGVFMGADQDNEEQLKKRLEMVNWARTYNSLTFLDKDDEYQKNEYSGLNGLSDILEKNMWLVSAALEMQGILFGDLKTGFANDTEALERYDETINGRCESYVRPVYDKLLKVLFIKENITAPIEYTFNSLLKQKQDKDRMESLKSFSDLLTQMLEGGAITSALYAKAMQNFVENGTVDLGLTEEEIKKIDDDFELANEETKII